ncbi:MAG: hypothetical protein AAGA30_12635, partial [Planctomycetota bacterium]
PVQSHRLEGQNLYWQITIAKLGNGFGTWTVNKTWKDQSNQVQSESDIVVLDQASKACVLDEAARIYDALLDRNMDSTEVELLFEVISEGALDKEALAQDLRTHLFGGVVGKRLIRVGD